MSKEKALEIIDNLTKTISKMGKSDGIYSDNPMFKGPRAKKSDLIKTRKKLKEKWKI